MKPTVGIIGGSGPLATVDIEQKILKATKRIRGVLTDQDYYNLAVLNYCSTHDRNDSVFFGKPEPLNQYKDYLLSITGLRVDLILLACNTAHMYLPFLKAETEIPIISIIDKTLTYFQSHFPHIQKVGLISTKATKEKKLYHDLFYKNSIEVIDIESSTQDSIMEAIYLIKSGVELDSEELWIKNDHRISEVNVHKDMELKSHPYKQALIQSELLNPKFPIENAIEELTRKGCKHIIFGCTELPLVIPYLKKNPEVRFIDPNEVIAEAIVEHLMELENQMWMNDEINIDKRKFG